MGLLDALLSDPGGSGGGLLDFLRNNAMNQNLSAGIGANDASYAQPQQSAAMPPMSFAPQQPMTANQPSSMDNAQWPAGPQGAPSQANAQAIPQQPPAVIGAQPMQQPQAPQAPQGPGMGDRLMAGLQSFANAGGPLQAIAGGIGGLATGQRNDPAGVALQQQQNTQNLTAQALLAKGADPRLVAAAVQPNNTEALKQLVDQYFGPPSVDNLGSGYIRDKRTGKVTRAYEPDDKTPAGFAKAEDGSMHFIPNGPADPEYKRLVAAKADDPNGVFVLGHGGELYKKDEHGNVTVVHKNESNVDASLDDGTAAMMAQQYLAGDKTVLQNVGRGAQGSANLVKIRTAIKEQADKQGLDGNGISQRMIDYVGDTARERTAATQEGRMSPAGIEAHGAIQLGRKASDAVPRGTWVPINKAIQAYQNATGDPALRAFGASNTTIINTYARAINPNGVGTVADKEHAREMLFTADGAPAYNAVLDQLDKEIEMAHRSPEQARAGFKAERAVRLGQPPAPDAGQTGAPKPGAYVWSPDKGLATK